MIVQIISIFYITAQAVVLRVPTSDIVSNIPGRLVRAPSVRSARIQHRVPGPRRFSTRLNQNRIRVRASNQDPLINIGDELHDWIRKNNVDRVLNYLQNKGSVQVRSTKGLTPLHAAVKFKQNDLFDMLIENGADINALDDQGRSVLLLARVVWNEYAMEKLRSMGARDSQREVYQDLAKVQAYLDEVNKLVPSGDLNDVTDEATWQKIKEIVNDLYKIMGPPEDIPPFIKTLEKILEENKEEAEKLGFSYSSKNDESENSIQKRLTLEEIEKSKDELYQLFQMDADQINESTVQLEQKLEKMRESIRDFNQT